MMIKVISLLLYLFLAPFAGALLDGVDRKITARMQGRKGPKLLQPFRPHARQEGTEALAALL